MTKDTSSPLVIVIEDQADIVDLIELILARKGYRVMRAYTADEGLHLVEQHHPDLVLLDLMMPQTDGWEVHRAMRQDPDLAQIPVVYVTAKASAADRLRAIEEEGAAGYVTKPFGPRELMEAVESALRGRAVPAS